MKTRVVLLLLFLSLPLHGADAASISFPVATLDILRNGTPLRFTVEVATTKEQQERGLMYRSSLPKQWGMLFLFPKPRLTSFWMKNTRIPLDMLFVHKNGIITRVKPNAVPESTTPITSDGYVLAVIELAGGSAARYHIVPGDRVLYPAFPKFP